MEIDFTPLIWFGAFVAFLPAFGMGVFVGAKFL